MENYTFEQLPQVIARMEEKLNLIAELLLGGQHLESNDIDILNIKEASKMLDLTVPTIYSKVCRRELPVFKKGNRLYFSKAELLEWIKSGKKKTDEEITMKATKMHNDLFNKQKKLRLR